VEKLQDVIVTDVVHTTIAALYGVKKLYFSHCSYCNRQISILVD